jgi:hypothetical protein
MDYKEHYFCPFYELLSIIIIIIINNITVEKKMKNLSSRHEVRTALRDPSCCCNKEKMKTGEIIVKNLSL